MENRPVKQKPTLLLLLLLLLLIHIPVFYTVIAMFNVCAAQLMCSFRLLSAEELVDFHEIFVGLTQTAYTRHPRPHAIIFRQ